MTAKDLGFEVVHIGLNHANEAEARATAELLQALFGFSTRETDAAIFVNEQFEVMKSPGRGRLGHIAVGTDDVEAAMAYLGEKGVRFEEGTVVRNDSGRVRLVYLADEIAGFRFHLSLKGK